ncbi:MAG: hypothetical protein H0X62_04485 [Bacteroidetes bacterium]|nr:hypothetical protein [Bacteroidota bacterium]
MQKENDTVFETPVFSRWPFTITKPGEPFYLTWYKNTAFGIQIILTSILSFFIWLIAVISG